MIDILSIDEAIAKYKEITNTDAVCPGHCNIPCEKCVQESEQLVEWLEELKDYRAKNKMVVRVDVDSIKDKIDELSKYAESQYDKAIDDFLKEICTMIVKSENNGNYRFYAVDIKQTIADLAEQLKAGVKNE